MSLENLNGISLARVEPDKATIIRLLTAAHRNIADSKIAAISDENKFDTAYKAILQLGNAALQANGFRTLTSRPGHHMTTLQTLDQTIGVPTQTLIILDALRKQRQAVDYSGDLVSPAAVAECIRQAESLYKLLEEWLKRHKPELLRE